MISGGNGANREHRQRTRKEIAGSGRCTHCPPHSGENYGWHGDGDGRFVEGRFVKSKTKNRK